MNVYEIILKISRVGFVYPKDEEYYVMAENFADAYRQAKILSVENNAAKITRIEMRFTITEVNEE